MAKLRSKGTLLTAEVASVMTPVTQSTSISFDGAEAETFDGRTLDQASAFVDDGCGYAYTHLIGPRMRRSDHLKSFLDRDGHGGLP